MELQGEVISPTKHKKKKKGKDTLAEHGKLKQRDGKQVKNTDPSELAKFQGRDVLVKQMDKLEIRKAPTIKPDATNLLQVYLIPKSV
jgi:hypothetical protein